MMDTTWEDIGLDRLVQKKWIADVKVTVSTMITGKVTSHK